MFGQLSLLMDQDHKYNGTFKGKIPKDKSISSRTDNGTPFNVQEFNQTSANTLPFP